jgi:hypothetical protein
MDNIRSTIDVIFNKRHGEDVLHSYFSLPQLRCDCKINQEWFIGLFRNEYNIYTNDQIKSIYAILKTKWIKEPIEFNLNRENSSVFYLLSHFTEHVLIEKNAEPVCKYEHLLRWREMSSRVGEDILTTSFLALRDISNHQTRNRFTWRPIITHDNPAIKNILKKGVADLHFHLRGSSLNFDINWLSLMNSIDKRERDFKTIEHYLQSPDVFTETDINKVTLHAIVIKACAIRLFLFNCLQNDLVNTNEGDALDQILQIQNLLELLNETKVVQRSIGIAKRDYGKRYDNRIIDYAIPSNLSQIELTDQNLYTNSILSGERWIMYNMFRKIYSGNFEFKSVSTLFYAYLVIKGRIRNELVQLNDRIGFDNFGQYEKRKDIFIKEGSVLDDLITHIAVNSTLQNQDLHYLEARITPKNSSHDTSRAVEKTDNQIKDKRFKIPEKINEKEQKEAEPLKYRHHYILHYIKGGVKPKDDLIQDLTPRNSILRSRVKKQTFAISLVKRRNPRISKRIVGIDAANTEIGCRPEVFGQAYRYLKNQPIKNRFEYLLAEKNAQLGFTYHVGEDYYDLADGLRAIDEAILFLNLTRSDRLGHGLALGIDANDYYCLANKTIVMPKQDFLDNIVWLLVKTKEYNISINSSLLYKLESWFEHYYINIYQNHINIYQNERPSIHDYYQSWLLRGDNPSRYLEDVEPQTVDLGNWDKYDLNTLDQSIKNARSNKKARFLFREYHFNAEAKKRGNESDEYIICNEYIKMIGLLQKEMRDKIARLHIGIETNPSSNKVISTSRLYSTHPITRFYNHGLESKDECLQIPVSINTDDQGIFCTSIENEFSLMALSLEKQKNDDLSLKYPPRLVYNWLDNVRELAFEQRFLKEEE